MATSGLLELELEVVNEQLALFKKAVSRNALMLGLSVTTCLLATPLLALQAWLTNSGSPLSTLAIGLVTAGTLFAIAYSSAIRRDRSFREIKLRALKLQRAGYVLYKKQILLDSILAASDNGPPDGSDAFDFNVLSIKEFEHYFA